MSTRKTLLAVTVAACVSAGAFSAGAYAAETPTHSFTGNVGLFSNYLFRGVSQTSKEAALQGGFDYAHASGFYAGTWGSNISWISDTAIYTGSSLELDLYGGYRGTVGPLGYDVGAIYYYYPGKKLPGVNSADTIEVYGGLSWSFLSAKVSYATTDYFGFTKSDGTYYVDLSANYPVGPVTLMGHVGYLKLSGSPGGVSNDKAFGYSDWKIGASYGLPKDFTVGAYYSDTDAKKAAYTVNGKNWAGGQAVVYLTKSF